MRTQKESLIFSRGRNESYKVEATTRAQNKEGTKVGRGMTVRNRGLREQSIMEMEAVDVVEA